MEAGSRKQDGNERPHANMFGRVARRKPLVSKDKPLIIMHSSMFGDPEADDLHHLQLPLCMTFVSSHWKILYFLYLTSSHTEYTEYLF